MQPKVQIVEDDPLIAEDLKIVLTERGFSVRNVSNSYEKGLEAFSKEHPDILLLDISLKGSKTGIDLANQINREGLTCPIVYITGTTDIHTKTKAFDTDPFMFLSKPFSEENIVLSVELALNKFQKNQQGKDFNFLFLKSESRFIKVEKSSISHLIGDGSYTKIITDTEELVQTGNLSSFEKKLGNSFIRIHRSYLVNISRIDSVDSQYVYVTGSKLPIGRKYKDNIKNIIN
jgi:DNA-binding LytR/AlgR family response regulator